MSNPNTLSHVAYEEESKNERNLPFHMDKRGRAIATGAAVMLAATGGAAVYHIPKSHETSVEQPSKSTNERQIDLIIDNGPVGESIQHSIEQDVPTSIAFQEYASELSKIDNLGYLTGQQAATLESAKKAEEDTKEAIGGSVYPGQNTFTWRDQATGMIITRVELSSK